MKKTRRARRLRIQDINSSRAWVRQTSGSHGPANMASIHKSPSRWARWVGRESWKSVYRQWQPV